jgi:hypothetical protein
MNGFSVYSVVKPITSERASVAIVFGLPSGRKVQIAGSETSTAEARDASNLAQIQSCSRRKDRIVFRAVVPRQVETPWYVAEFDEKGARWAEVGQGKSCPESAAPSAWRR